MKFSAWMNIESSILVAHVTRDDVSMLLSSFRETIQSLAVQDDLAKQIGVGYPELKRATSRLRTIAEEAPSTARSVNRPITFAVSGRDVIIVECHVGKSLYTIQASPEPGILSLVTTLGALKTSLRCAKQMISYLWLEEVQTITGYTPDEISKFEHELVACVDEARWSAET